jgi:hypothetical protein
MNCHFNVNTPARVGVAWRELCNVLLEKEYGVCGNTFEGRLEPFRSWLLCEQHKKNAAHVLKFALMRELPGRLKRLPALHNTTQPQARIICKNV